MKVKKSRLSKCWQLSKGLLSLFGVMYVPALFLRVLEADGLGGWGSLNSYPDPYCQVTILPNTPALKSEVRRGNCRKKTTSPNFQDIFSFAVCESDPWILVVSNCCRCMAVQGCEALAECHCSSYYVARSIDRRKGVPGPNKLVHW